MGEVLQTGGVARFLDVGEPRLADLLRRHKIQPEPEVFLGRRVWFTENVIGAAEALGVLTPELRQRIESETVSEGSASRG